MDKPVVIFTNFWDADKLLKRGHFLCSEGEFLYKVMLYEDPRNYKVCSIALSHPPLDRLPVIKSKFSKLERLNFFCPTYNMLKDHKDGGEWSDYVKQYMPLLKSRKDSVLDWFKSLESNHVYILCCWENTSKGAHCHRQLMYDAFTKSKSLKDKAIYIYRSGSWNDDYESKGIYQYISSELSKGGDNVPVTLSSQSLADEMGMPIGSTIGTATAMAEGAWVVNITTDVNQALNDLLCK